MLNQSRKLLLQLTGCCSALAFTCIFSLPASALASSFAGTFEDDGSVPDIDTDDFRITNDLASTEDIITVVFDLSTAVTGTTFEPGTWAFSATLATQQRLALREKFSPPRHSR